ncbi:MAG TPA: dihydrolipoamide acetyltransferase family protein [Armatimonadota bacterium]|nr:dihydrolipoamide acetyltransferase family protein [Armatimonadota bacterium]
MAMKFILPMLGQTMEEGTITKWLKKEGDAVEKGEPLVEVMTDKVNMEVESPASGILRKIVAQEEETIPVMELLAIIGTADEPIDDLLSESEAPSRAETPEAVSPTPSIVLEVLEPKPTAVPTSRVFISPRAKRLAKEHGIPVEALAGKGTGPSGRVTEKDVLAYAAMTRELSKVKATPLAAKIATDKRIDLREIVGSGPHGKVTREDVLQAVTAPRLATLTEKIIPFTGMRKMVADAVAKSAQTAPHVTLTAEVDMTEAVKLRTQVLPEFERKYGVRLSFTDLITKAVARAILDHPIVNASLEGNQIRIHGEVNVGLAVALDDGLIVPVIHNADRKSLPEISLETKQLAEKARAGKLSGREISGGTFSITNLGAYGIDIFNPVITPGQSAILGVCRIADKPVVVGGQILIRSMMNLCLSFDHRVMDGAPAAQFLANVKEMLEAPNQLLV